MVQLDVGGEARVEHAMQLHGDVRFLGRVFGRAVDRDLLEADLGRSLAGDVRLGDRVDVEMPPGEAYLDLVPAGAVLVL